MNANSTIETRDSRTWPFTIRITRRERWLLLMAARRQKTSKAGIARIGLDPLFDRLATKIGHDDV